MCQNLCARIQNCCCHNVYLHAVVQKSTVNPNCISASTGKTMLYADMGGGILVIISNACERCLFCY